MQRCGGLVKISPCTWDSFNDRDVWDSEMSRANLAPLFGISSNPPLVATQAKVVNEIPLDRTVCFLSQVPLHNLAIDIFSIWVIVGVEILFHRYQRGSSHSFRLPDSDCQTPISPAPGHPACCECETRAAHLRPSPTCARNPDRAHNRPQSGRGR